MEFITPADPTGSSIANCTLQYLQGQRVWLATFSVNYASVPTTAFVKHIPCAGDIVILKCADVTHVWVLGTGGTQDIVY
jgi:hypothetical protein